MPKKNTEVLSQFICTVGKQKATVAALNHRDAAWDFLWQRCELGESWHGTISIRQLYSKKVVKLGFGVVWEPDITFTTDI